jgi:solute carrier family 25 uncoupling protein 8/9
MEMKLFMKLLSCNSHNFRLSICNIGEVVTYDTVKTSILRRGWMEDAFPLHFTSAVCAGFVTTTLTSPVDVVKTRYVNSSPGEFRSPIQCAGVLAREGGFKIFYKG